MQKQSLSFNILLVATATVMLASSSKVFAKDSNCSQFLGSPAIVSRLEDLKSMLLVPEDKLHRQVPSPFNVIDELIDRPEEWTDEARDLLLQVSELAFRTPHLHELQKADLLRLTGEHGLYSPELAQLVVNEISERPVLRFIGDGTPNSTQYLLSYLEKSQVNGLRLNHKVILQLKQAQQRAQLAYSQRDKDRYPYLFADWSPESSPRKSNPTPLLLPFLVEDFNTALKLYSRILSKP